ncbi:MAG: Fe-S cluster assembly ATPase SufC [Sumerlaeia bacterium]
MLEIKNLHARIDDEGDAKEILHGLDLKVGPGEVHAIMGPNGSGKSTLARILAGAEDYEITDGDVLLEGESILEDGADERAHKGIFMAFQYPVEIPGITNNYFLRSCLNSIREANGKDEMSAGDFLKLIREKAKLVEIDEQMLKRSVNVGFSGGEKKRNEILQMAVLEPKLCVLDETDSGLDIDALKVVAKGVNAMRSPDRSFIVVTHYQRLLNYIEPDFVHVLVNGRIIESGDKTLALRLEEEGYDWAKAIRHAGAAS